MTDYGAMTNDTERALVRFERDLAAAIDTVWDLIATGHGLEQWLAPATVDPTVGGAVDIDFGEEGLAGGTIIELVRGSILEYHWQFPGEPDSIVRFELRSVGDGTRLVLEHRLLPLDQADGYGAGWHAHIDHLEAVATGSPARVWAERFAELLPAYRKI